MTRPEFIDNRDGNTLAKALGEALLVPGVVLDDDSSGSPEDLCIATGFFSASGFGRIARYVESIPSVRLMLGVDLGAEKESERPPFGETKDSFERKRMQAGIRAMESGLRKDRDRLPFAPSSEVALRKLVKVLRAGNMSVRRYEKDFLHAKAYIFGAPAGANESVDGLIAGSSNLTAAGLTRNLELDIGRYDRPIVDRARKWFDELWAEAEPYDLAILFEDVLRTRSPWEVFIRVLWQLYGDEVDDEVREDDNLPLTTFQKHGVARALRLLRESGGAIIADEVGLGKTFIAGEILQVYRDRRQRALLICPAALRDTTWRKFQARFEMFVECLSFEELAQDAQLKAGGQPANGVAKLERSLDEYQLVIVDEAHNYRNPNAPMRAGVLRRLLYGQRRDVLLLTATPVNNSLWDLFHLIGFFVRQDARFADRGILSIRALFDQAMREDPTDLSPDLLFPLIDATTVKRTREFVKKHYEGDTIKGADGLPLPIVFPKPQAISVHYNLDELQPGFFDRIEAALDPESATALTFARYTPNDFRNEACDDEFDESAQAITTVGLLRSGLLKRFESSAYAFRRTVEKMSEEHRAFLKALDEGYVVTTDFMRELSADDDAIFEEVLAGTEHRRDATNYDVSGLRSAVQTDLEGLEQLVDTAREVTKTQQHDPKLRLLAIELEDIARDARRQADGDVDERNKRKVLVFSFFEDTVKWIRDYLQVAVNSRPELAAYKGRVAAVSGSGDLEEVSRQQAVHGFAPVSMEARSDQRDLYDILVSTDVLAEGVNLQQCRHIINFDMPWNPMRLVQRHGRIDRIGSPHNRVFLRTIFPADRLDRLLKLERRILDKLAMAAASVGVAAPIEGAAHGPQVFTETREEIEKLLKEDASLYERGGTAGAAQTGEEYRQTLRKALDQGREGIVDQPRKIGSGMVKGARSGVFFCATVGERTYLRFVSAEKDWRVSGAERAIVRETGTCLRLIECEPDTPTWYSDELGDRVYDFWEAAKDDIWSDWMRETDPANLQPKVRPLNLRVADFIRSNPPGGMSQDRVTRALDILESPWPRREEMMLRTWFDSEEREGTLAAAHLVGQILGSGLEPVESPQPLPPITPEDVELVCWIGINGSS